MKTIQFRVGKQTVEGNIFTPKKVRKLRPAFLIVHGWESQQNRGYHLAKALTKIGYIAMTFDLRGHGVSEGNYKTLSRAEFLKDVVAAYDTLCTVPGVNPANISLIGSSFGSYLSLLLSEKRKVKSLVLRVPANYQDAGFTQPQYLIRTKKNVAQWKEQLQKHTATKALRALHKFNGKVLIVESKKDELVPVTVVQSYANAVINKKKLTYKIMKNAPHSISRFPKFQGEYKNLVLNWLK